MKKHTETLVKLRAYKADLADRLITAWGTDKVFLILDEIVRNHAAFASTMTEAVFAIKADHLHQFPKVVPFSFDHLPEALSTDPDFTIIRERFPHIGKQIATDWGTPKSLEYFEKLMMDDRQGKRQGFPLEAYQSLMKLFELHNLTFPSLKKASTDPWEIL